MIKTVNRETRIRVKNINTGVSFEFFTHVEAARFVGTTDGYMRYAIRDEQARVFCIDGEEYVFEYDNEER